MQDLDLEKILEENRKLKKENKRLKKMIQNLESKNNLNNLKINNEDNSFYNNYQLNDYEKTDNMSIISFLLRSEKRVKILKSLRQEDKIPSKIGKEIGDSSHHVSKYLTNLKEKGLVVCLNEDDKRYRFYRITSKGRHYLEIIEKKKY